MHFGRIIICFVCVATFVVALDLYAKDGGLPEQGAAHGSVSDGKTEHVTDGHHVEGVPEAEHSENNNVGPDFAVVAFHESDGFKLSDAAMKRLEIRTAAPRRDSAGWVIPRSGVIRIQETVSVFRLRDGFFKRVAIRLLSDSSAEDVIATSDDLQSGDEIASLGGGLLRATEMDLTGGAGQGSAD